MPPLTPEQAQARELLLELAQTCRDDGDDELARRIERGATDGVPQVMAVDIVRSRGLVAVMPAKGLPGWAVRCCHGQGRHPTWWYEDDVTGVPA